MDPALSPGLFDIHLSDSEDNNDEPAEGSSNSSASRTPADRTAQSEEEFRAVKAAYRVKVENGEIWKTAPRPIANAPVPKPEAQTLLHAVEELYFFRRYDEGARFVDGVLGGGGGGGGRVDTAVANEDGGRDDKGALGLDRSTRELLRYYQKRCIERGGGRGEKRGW
ncbi:uncharacterized protein GGS25DRAFT_390399 [Hypoxylon fragiforme]|uniref:uncharacterized protein n=1 Tax=Hypoxylon fragiforme TaxID=63214 RepID=UPI0020C5EE95|nr:uncharacterized protein GGS25DRAFT_390399 [Hypoxylon fragiforme]KAI2606436.1 hypothetical protein GGS25DRAFT_390399 [Hypoxylon fragiforme]